MSMGSFAQRHGVVTDEQWEIAHALLPRSETKGVHRTSDRQVLNAILYVVRERVAWRALPRFLPSFSTVLRRREHWDRDQGIASVLHGLLSLEQRHTTLDLRELAGSPLIVYPSTYLRREAECAIGESVPLLRPSAINMVLILKACSGHLQHWRYTYVSAEMRRWT